MTRGGGPPPGQRRAGAAGPGYKAGRAARGRPTPISLTLLPLVSACPPPPPPAAPAAPATRAARCAAPPTPPAPAGPEMDRPWVRGGRGVSAGRALGFAALLALPSAANQGWGELR